jgi:hypothetical protein
MDAIIQDMVLLILIKWFRYQTGIHTAYIAMATKSTPISLATFNLLFLPFTYQSSLPMKPDLVASTIISL